MLRHAQKWLKGTLVLKPLIRLRGIDSELHYYPRQVYLRITFTRSAEEDGLINESLCGASAPTSYKVQYVARSSESSCFLL